jgi:hypothetical protein
MWKKVRPILIEAKLDPVRVENPIYPGTPDVNLADGKWIELKCIPGWPVRASSNVRISHYTQQQRVWLYRRWKYAPGSTLLLLEVRADRQWLLFDGNVAAKIVGQSTAAEHRAGARAVLAERELAGRPPAPEPRGQGADDGHLERGADADDGRTDDGGDRVLEVHTEINDEPG